MPFLRFSRDKRGYEHFYIVHSTTRRGRSRSRILYWFRTPPNVKVGRQPFDEPLRRALEAQNPDVTFDWQSLIETPIPPPVEPERWRERRRLEKAAKLEAQAEAAAEAEEQAPDSVSGNEPVLEVPPHNLAIAESAQLPGTAVAAAEAAAVVPEAPFARRRRRRGRRGHRPLGAPVQTLRAEALAEAGAGAQFVEPNQPSNAPQSSAPGEPVEIEEENDAPPADGEV